MDLEAFTASLSAAEPSANLAPPLVALWHAAHGDWDAAHHIAQQQEGEAAHDWVHAYLHRVEGDLGNAGYWYRRAGKSVPQGDLDAERDSIVAALLARS